MSKPRSTRGGSPGSRLDKHDAAAIVARMSETLFAIAARRGVPAPRPPHTPHTLGEFAAAVFLHPVRGARKMPRELAYLRGAERLALPTSYGTLAAWQWGARERPLVGLLHGWEGHGAQLGAFAAPLVDAGFRVLTFDAPGHGESPGDECSAPMVGRVVVELEAQVGRFAGLVAHSMGAAAAAMAVTRGVQPRGLVFLAPPLSQDDRVGRMARRCELDPATATAFAAAVERRTGLALEEADMRHVARRTPCPLLALHDPEDQDAAYADTEAFVAAWRGARLVPCPGRGHHRILATPEVVRQAVEFLRGLPESPR